MALMLHKWTYKEQIFHFLKNFGLKHRHRRCQWGRSGARREADALRNLCQRTPYGTVSYNTKSDIDHVWFWGALKRGNRRAKGRNIREECRLNCNLRKQTFLLAPRRWRYFARRFLLAKRPPAAMSEEKRLFSQAKAECGTASLL